MHFMDQMNVDVKKYFMKIFDTKKKLLGPKERPTINSFLCMYSKHSVVYA